MNKTYQSFVMLTLLLFIGIFCGITAAPAQTIDTDFLMNFWLNSYSEANCVSHWTEEPAFPMRLLAKAAPDESFNGIGNPFIADPFSPQGQPKVNEAYVWGLTKSGNNLWLGTMSNTLCSVIWFLGEGFGTYPEPYVTPSTLCEFNQSLHPGMFGDWRPPRIYRYDTQTQTLVDKTPQDTLINSTSGFRSAGNLDDVVLIGGPGEGGISLFAFNSKTEEFLGAKLIEEYTDIRQWLVVDSVLYTAVLNVDGGGSVLRWTGDVLEPFKFEIVGNLDNQGANIAYHNGRIFVTTWPALSLGSPSMAGLYMSPVIPPGGLTPVDADSWEKVWSPSDYEPDLVTAFTYGGGALASFDGYLYWGTMHVPFSATIAHLIYYEPEDSLTTFLGTYRPISIFRGRNFAAAKEIDLVYGSKLLPKYTPNNLLSPTDGGKWEISANNMNALPLYGPAGFCNFFNNYTWTMSVYEGQLFVGTMDWSYMYDESMPQLLAAFQLNFSTGTIQLPVYQIGGDLFRFPSTDSRAYAESLSGVGNYSSYGIRTMVSDDALYLGMANPMNLLTDTTDAFPEGGWELIQIGGSGSGVNHSDASSPAGFNLSQNYPNPFNPYTTINFTLAARTQVTLIIYDILGHPVRKLIDGNRQAGSHTIIWDGLDDSGNSLSSGIYFYRVKTDGGHSAIKKMIYTK